MHMTKDNFEALRKFYTSEIFLRTENEEEYFHYNMDWFSYDDSVNSVLLKQEEHKETRLSK